MSADGFLDKSQSEQIKWTHLRSALIATTTIKALKPSAGVAGTSCDAVLKDEIIVRSKSTDPTTICCMACKQSPRLQRGQK